MWLINASDKPLSELIDRKIYTLNPEEPLEVPTNDGKTILKRIGNQGIAEVPVYTTKNGIDFNTAAGKAFAKAAMKEGYKALITAYLRNTEENRTRKGLPALPPCPATRKAFEALGDSPENHGVSPVGMEDLARRNNSDAQIDALRQALDMQQKQFAELQAQLAQMAARVVSAPITPEEAPAAGTDKTPSKPKA